MVSNLSRNCSTLSVYLNDSLRCFGVHSRSNDLDVPVLLARACQLTRPTEFVVIVLSASVMPRQHDVGAGHCML